MLYYVCKYAPVEAFASMGVPMERLEPEVASFPLADSYLHPNLCSFVKGALEAFDAACAALEALLLAEDD